MADIFLGIDIGTGGCKLTALDLTRGFIAENHAEITTTALQPGWAEQNPADWLKAFHTCFDEMVKGNHFKPQDIAALCIDASTHNAVLLDKNNDVLRPCIMWNDQRSYAEADWLFENHGKMLWSVTYQKPSPTWTLPQLLWIKRNEPDLFLRIHRLCSIKDYLRWYLTGEWGTELVDAGGTMLMDFEKKKWSEEICTILGLPLSCLPPIGRSTDVVGYVLPEKARRLGLHNKVAVAMGASDTAIEDFAAGVVNPGQCIVKLATAGNVNIFTDTPQPTPYSFTYYYVIPGMYYSTMGTNAAAASLRWFRDNVVHKTGADLNFNEIEQMAHGVPAGSAGVLYHPYLNGERSPYFDPHLRASFIGLSSYHDIRHMTRSVLEGVAYSLKDCLLTARDAGLVPDKGITLIGGGSKSALWCQIVADVLAHPVRKVSNDDSSMGSAMLAGVSIGAFSSFTEAVKKCTVLEKEYMPDSVNIGKYESMFTLYKEVQSQLSYTYTKLNRMITMKPPSD